MSSVFRFNDAHDRESASDGVSRYGFYLSARRREMFGDWDDEDEDAVTRDPAQFTRAAWEIANSPIMAPPYLDWDADRLQTLTCTTSEHDGTLIVRAQLAVPDPAQLRHIRGYAGWDRGRVWGSDDGYFTPYDDALARRPAMLSSTVLLINIPTDQLYVPKDAPGELSVDDAKASIRRLAELLEDRLTPVLEALDR